MTLMPAAVLSALLVAQPSQGPDRRAEAERLARAGQRAQALKEFQALAAANPDDIEARLWIARLHAEMGNQYRAVDVYQSILATAPQNVDALLGLGDALLNLGRLTDAGDALNRAEAIAADRPAVLAAQGRLHSMARRSTLALAYYQRAMALDPANISIRDAYDDLRAERAHRVEGTYYFEHFDIDVPDTHAGFVEVNARVTDSFRVFADGQHQRKFALDEDRGGAGLEWSPRHDVWVRAGALFGSGTEVLPDREVAFEAQYSRHGVQWLGGVRYVHFADSRVVIVSPGVTFSPRESLTVTARYYCGQIVTPNSVSGEGDNGWLLDGTAHVTRRFWINAGYARSFESLPLLSADYLAIGRSNIVFGGFRFDPLPLTSIAATWQQQWRRDVNVGAAIVTLTQRF